VIRRGAELLRSTFQRSVIFAGVPFFVPVRSNASHRVVLPDPPAGPVRSLLAFVKYLPIDWSEFLSYSRKSKLTRSGLQNPSSIAQSVKATTFGTVQLQSPSEFDTQPSSSHFLLFFECATLYLLDVPDCRNSGEVAGGTTLQSNLTSPLPPPTSPSLRNLMRSSERVRW
jgi:hypothetical protein